MAEIAADGERRRGEDPGAGVAVELPAENAGDGKRRGVQLKRVAEHLDPANAVGAAVVAPAFEHGLRLSRALGAACQTLASLGYRPQRSAQGPEHGIERGERVGKSAVSPARCPGEARAF